MNDVNLARALHVLAVVIWIGGVSMATTIVLPAVRRGDLGADRLKAFRAVEHRFVWQARIAILVVGLSGFYMIVRQDLWDRFGSPAFWWMHAMAGVWVLFALILFVAEPLVLHRSLQRWASTQPDRALAWLQKAHYLLLALAVVTILGAVAGSWGGALF